MGIIVGAAGTLLGMNIMKESSLDNIGTGLTSLFSDDDRSGNTELSDPDVRSVEEPIPEVTFSFHEMLMDEEYVLPPSQEKPKETATPKESASTTTAKPQPVAKPAQPATEKGYEFVIQVGSFRKFEEADSVKAQLALHGMRSYIQKVTVEGRGEFYRVRLGPFAKYEQLEMTTQQLVTQGYRPLRYRVRVDG